MSAAVASELTPFDSQREAFARLLVRFTADRDALIASVRDCEDRLTALAARVERRGPAAASGEPHADGPTGESSQLDEVRELVQQTRAELERMVVRARAEAVHATERADEALRRVDAGPRGEQAAPAEREKIHHVVESMRRELEHVRRRVETQQAHGESGEGLDRETVAQLQEQVSRANRELTSLRLRIEKVAELARPPSGNSRRGEESGVAPHLALVEDLRREVRALRTAAAWGPGFRRISLLLVVSVLATAMVMLFGSPR